MAKTFIFVALLALLATVQCLEITSSRSYYTSENKEVMLSCGETAWSSNNFVTFYRGNDELIFNSESKDKFPFVSGTKDNRWIILNSDKVKGWQNLYCISNSIISQNTLNIPLVVPPVFTHTPDKFEINTTYTLTCEGAVLPRENANINFRFEKYVIGTLSSDGSLSLGNAPGIGLILSDRGRNSIRMIPQYNSNYGTYYCDYDFVVSGKKRDSVKSNTWTVVKP